MATLDATVGGATSNSYVTLEEAQDYYETRTEVVGWENADDQSVLLMMATRVMDAMARPHTTFIAGPPPQQIISATWTGAPATTTQKLAWPRTGMYDQNGNVIPSDVIPQDLKDAVSELAGQLGTADLTVDNAIIVQGITSIKAGSVSLSFKDMIERHVIPDFVYSLMPSSWFTDEIVVYVQSALFDVVSD